MADAMTIALVCPDGLSILLFCKGIIRSLQTVPGARVIVVSDAGPHAAEIEALGATSVSVPIARWINPWEDWKYARRLADVFRRERVNVVLNFSTKANIYGSVAARWARVPLVLSHVVGLGGAFQPARSLKDRVLQTVVRALYRRACAISRYVWFTNPNDVEYFVSHGLITREKVVLSRNYLDVSAYAPGSVPDAAAGALRRELSLPEDALVVVMVARLIWPKGIREFVDAARLLRQRHPRAWFLLVAPPETGSPDAVPESWVRDAEREANFRWLGFRSDVPTVYAVSDVAVLPSYYKEGGYPRALLEPMSMGKPLITTTSEDCRATVEEGRNGLLVPPRDGGALAAAIDQLLTNPEQRTAFGRRSAAKAREQFDEGPIVSAALRALGLQVRAETPTTTP